MNEIVRMYSLMAYVICKSHKSAADRLGYSCGATIANHILQLEAARGEMLKRNSHGWMTPMLTEYGREYVARNSGVEGKRVEEAAQRLFDFPNISASEMKEAISLLGERAIVQLARVVSVAEWPVTRLLDVSDAVDEKLAEAMTQAAINLVERATAHQLSPPRWEERPFFSGAVTHGNDRGISDDTWASMVHAMRVLSQTPRPVGLWFVSCPALYYEFVRLVDQSSAASVVGPANTKWHWPIQIQRYDADLFDSNREYLATPVQLDMPQPEPPPHMIERPWFCVMPGIWLEMSDGRHRIVGDAKELFDWIFEVYGS